MKEQHNVSGNWQGCRVISRDSVLRALRCNYCETSNVASYNQYLLVLEVSKTSNATGIQDELTEHFIYIIIIL